MRKIILFIHSTLNGVVTGDPSKDRDNFTVWTTEASIQTGSECLLKTFETVDTILLGHRTYEGLAAAWPSVADWPGVNELALRLGEKVNHAAKLVVTRAHARDELRWGKFAPPERLTGDDIEQQLRDLKRGAGGDMIIFGSPTLVRSLTNANLIDEYQLQIHPVVVDAGDHLFDRIARKDLDLVAARSLDDGSVFLRYRPAPA